MKLLIPVLVALFTFVASAQSLELGNPSDIGSFFGYGLYGPQRTVRWNDYGTFRIPKFVDETVTIDAGGQLVNEVFLRAQDNRVEIQSAIATLADGTELDMRFLTGTIRQDQEIRSLVHYYYSMRIRRIEFKTTSPNVIGSRGQLQIVLGMAE